MRKKGTFFSVLAVLVLSAVAAWASGGGEGHADDGMVMNLVLRTVNFAVFAGILWYLGGKKLIGFFSDRRAQIETELENLKSRREDAESKLKETERRIANLANEREQILSDYRKQGEALKENIISKAMKSAEEIKSQAKLSAEQEAGAAIDGLRAQMADMIAEAAEKLLKQKLSTGDHEKLIDDYLTKVVLN